MSVPSIRIHGFAALVCTCALALPAAALAGGPGGASAGGTSGGTTGPTGKSGATAKSGASGKSGAMGKPGATGATGATGTSGPAGPAGPLPETITAGSITCSTQCLAIDSAKPGSTVRLTGDGMQSVAGLVFLGAKGPQDDTGAKVSSVKPGVAEAVVPAGAVSGPVTAVGPDGTAVKPTAKPLRIGVVGPDQIQAAVASGKVFFGGRRTATLNVFVPPGTAQDVRVNVVRATDGAAVAQLDGGIVAPSTVAAIPWRGVAGGRVQPDGKYAFQLAAPTQAPTAAPAPFTFLRNEFPIRGKHQYGTGIARYGAARNGHVHQGQDVFAACGTPLVAARGGTIKYAGFQSQAGNYLVIDGAGTGSDYVYMHLRDPVEFAKGDAVATGQPIGVVGQTGDATACHLHFEVWTAPGWFTGGKTVDPEPLLQEWDTQSGVATPAVAKQAVAARATAARAAAAR